MVWATSAVLLVYPIGVYFGLRYLEPRHIGVIIFVLVGSRLLLARPHLDRDGCVSLLPSAVMVVLVSLLLLIFNQVSLIYLNPVLLNGVMLATFSYSLLRPPTIIERFARLSDSNLSPRAILYTRRVTQVWCLFFLCNGITAAYTGMYASMRTWALYNGFVAYIIMGVLIVGEYLVRIRKRQVGQL